MGVVVDEWAQARKRGKTPAQLQKSKTRASRNEIIIKFYWGKIKIPRSHCNNKHSKICHKTFTLNN